MGVCSLLYPTESVYWPSFFPQCPSNSHCVQAVCELRHSAGFEWHTVFSTALKPIQFFFPGIATSLSFVDTVSMLKSIELAAGETD